MQAQQWLQARGFVENRRRSMWINVEAYQARKVEWEVAGRAVDLLEKMGQFANLPSDLPALVEHYIGKLYQVDRLHRYLESVLVDRVEQALAAAAADGDANQEAHRLRYALASLSPREREVLDQLILGHYNKNIADHLGITQRTVEFHRANIFEKMGVSSAIELAHKLGRLQPIGTPPDKL